VLISARLADYLTLFELFAAPGIIENCAPSVRDFSLDLQTT